MDCLFSLLIVSSDAQKFFILIKSNLLLFFLLLPVLLESYLRILCQIQDHEELPPMFSFKRFMALALILRSLILFCVDFSIWYEEVNVILSSFCMWHSVVPASSAGGVLLPLWWARHPRQRSLGHKRMGLFLKSHWSTSLSLCQCFDYFRCIVKFQM